MLSSQPIIFKYKFNRHMASATFSCPCQRPRYSLPSGHPLCFPALAIGYMFSRVCHLLHFSPACYWLHTVLSMKFFVPLSRKKQNDSKKSYLFFEGNLTHAKMSVFCFPRSFTQDTFRKLITFLTRNISYFHRWF